MAVPAEAGVTHKPPEGETPRKRLYVDEVSCCAARGGGGLSLYLLGASREVINTAIDAGIEFANALEQDWQWELRFRGAPEKEQQNLVMWRDSDYMPKEVLPEDLEAIGPRISRMEEVLRRIKEGQAVGQEEVRDAMTDIHELSKGYGKLWEKRLHGPAFGQQVA